ncbi:MAG: sugar transferase [Leptolyngbyaceae cyanobacterium SL_5_9]|nr:sugar transferase [Leptolyngbyaceae cyanobacterium SL_5_9]NJO72751.1 sugar transferase [Leptolyngbyaceae cyanobacterium RM1_406_9]
MLKRLFDIVVALLILSITAPLLLLVPVLIKLDSPGVVLCPYPCIGQKGKPFGLIRFRRMDRYYDPQETTERQLTRIGAIIRNYSLDDIPNLLNVLKGSLSIIGPCPSEPHFVDVANPEWQTILSVRPGWIGLAILSLGSSFNASDPQVKRQLELQYVERQSLIYDLALLIKAVRSQITSRGNIKARGRKG